MCVCVRVCLSICLCLRERKRERDSEKEGGGKEGNLGTFDNYKLWREIIDRIRRTGESTREGRRCNEMIYICEKERERGDMGMS